MPHVPRILPVHSPVSAVSPSPLSAQTKPEHFRKYTSDNGTDPVRFRLLSESD